jgi:uncharacterized protein YyaL (SSP411 family)
MFKKILLVVLVWFSFAFTTGDTVKSSLDWQEWNEGFIAANSQQKIALIDVYTDWCGWCKRMDKNTYENAQIIDKINSHFVPIKFNPEKKGNYVVGNDTFSGRQLEMALSQNKKSGYPTTFFYLPTKNAMIQRAGYMDANSFGKLLDEMIAKAK